MTRLENVHQLKKGDAKSWVSICHIDNLIRIKTEKVKEEHMLADLFEHFAFEHFTGFFGRFYYNFNW